MSSAFISFSGKHNCESNTVCFFVRLFLVNLEQVGPISSSPSGARTNADVESNPVIVSTTRMGLAPERSKPVAKEWVDES